MNRIWIKFFASYVVIILVALLVWGTTSAIFIEKYMLKEKRQQLLTAGQEINQALANWDSVHMGTPLLRVLSRRFDGDLYLTDARGLFIASSLGRQNLDLMLTPEIMKEINNGRPATRLWETESQKEVIAVAIPLMPQEKVIGAMVLVSPVKGVEAAVNAVQSQVVKAGLIALILGAIASLGVSYGMTRQIREISTAVSRFAKQEMNYRVPIITRDELGDIAQGINEMAEQIASSNTRRQALLAGVSHEVRTPLTNIRGYIEALRDGLIAEKDHDQTLELIHGEAIMIEKMVSDLIDLARMDSENYSINKSQFNLTEVMKKVVRKYEPLALAKNDIIEAFGDEPLIITADQIRIEQLIGNLVKNALQFTKEGRVLLTCCKTNGKAEIIVEDTGMGIAKDQLPYVFDSFYKAEPSRVREYNESGLGLAIVQAIVRLHDGNIAISSEPGKGTRVKITLPL